MSAGTLRAHPHAVAAGVLVLALWALLVRDVLARPPCYVDEPGWITSGAVTLDLVSGWAGPARWERAYDDRGLGNWGHLNPPLGKLLLGAALAAARRPDDVIDYRWNLQLDHAGNAAAGTLPPPRLLVPVRLAVSACGALALLGVYVLALQVTRAPWLSLLAPIALFASPIFHFHAARAYTDVPQLAWILAALCAFLSYLSRGGLGRLVAAGVLAGLATATKLSAGMLAPTFALGALLRPAPIASRARDAVVPGALAFAVFVAVNPYLYPDPIGRSLEIVSGWSQVYANFTDHPSLAATAVTSRSHGLALVAQRALLTPWFDHPLLHALQAALPALVLVAAAALVVTLGRARIEARAPRSPRFLGLVGAVVLVAAARLALGIRLAAGALVVGVFALAAGDGGPADPRARRFFLLAFALTLLSTGLWLPFDWQRYYLRSVALLPVVYVAGIVAVARAFAVRPRELPAADGSEAVRTP